MVEWPPINNNSIIILKPNFLPLSLSSNFLETSTTQPIHLPTLIYISLPHILWYHSCKINHSTTSSLNCGLSPSLTLISLLNAQPLNHFISLWYHSCEINHSTISPISDISLPHSLSYHSWKLNHSTTSSPNCGLSPSLTIISLF